MTPSRLRSAVLTLLAIATLAGGAATRAHAQACSLIDPCCAAKPLYTDPNYASFIGQVLVGTREAESGTGFVLTLFDITPPYPGNGTNFAAVQRYHGPANSWDVNNLGSVFGLTIDKYGNILVCHTTCYNGDFTGPGGWGAVYRIANGTGAINTFVNLPNVSGAGLGNISYDCEHDQFFVTNMEDGTIYRIKTATANAATASIVETFDPLGPDDGSAGFAPLGERLWAVQWHAGRVYYSVWTENCGATAGPENYIRSVGLDAFGAFQTASDQFELSLPPHVTGYTHPISDISFGPKGTMFIAERSMSGPSSAVAHESRLMEFGCDPAGGPGWAPMAPYLLGVNATCCCSGIGGGGTNSSGGVDVDWDGPYSPATPFGRVWGTSDAIDNFLTVYGIQGLPPGGGNAAVSAWVDFDGTALGTEKTNLGDVEVPCPFIPTATTMSMFLAEPSGDALRVRWAFGDASEVASVSLERAPRETGPWEAMAAEVRVEGGVTVALDREVEAGHTYFYRLVVSTTSGESMTFGPVSGSLAEAVSRFAITEVSPNPAHGAVEVEFSLPRASVVKVSVLDVQGREIATLADGSYRAGRHTVRWVAPSTRGRTSGALYFVRYRTPAGDFTRQLVVTP